MHDAASTSPLDNHALTSRITPLATLTPASTTRAWQSIPHPSLPIIATASSDKSVRVYSLTNFNLVSSITGGHKRSVRCCSWKPHIKGESVLATGSFDASCGIWRKWETDVVPNRGQAGEGYEDFTHGGQNDKDDDEEEEDGDDYRFSVILDGHESEIKSLAWSSSGQYLATCSRDKSVWIWEDMDDEGDNFETVAVLQEHEADVKTVAWHPHENLLASGSYDDCVRLWKEDIDDWTCCARLEGHESTVWWVTFEPEALDAARLGVQSKESLSEERQQFLEDCRKAGPRLISCSDDKTIRLWKRRPNNRPDQQAGPGRMPSILRTHSVEEDWFQECILPAAHERAIYSVAWSAKSGLIASTGSDGKIVVYREEWKATDAGDVMQIDSGTGNGDAAIDGAATTNGAKTQGNGITEWKVVAVYEGAHEVFEVNHATWARRRDKGRTSEDEEIIITTGDDGEVKAWVIEDGA